MIISLDLEKALDETEHLFKIKTLNNLGREETSATCRMASIKAPQLVPHSAVTD